MKILKSIKEIFGFFKSGMYYNSFKILLLNSPILTVTLLTLIVLSGLLWPLNTYFLQLVINAFTDFFSGTGSQSAIAISLLFMIIGLVFFPIVDNIINLLKVRLTYNMQKWYRKQIFYKVKNLDYKMYEDKEMYDLYLRVNKTVDLPLITVLSLIEVLKQVVSVIGFTIIIVQAQWLIIPFVALFVVPLIRIRMKNADKTYKLSVERSSSIRYASYLSGFFFDKNIIREMSIFGFKKYIEKKWSDLYTENFKEQQKVTLSNDIYLTIGMMIHGFGGMFATFLLFIPLAMGRLQLGSFVAANDSIGKLTVLLAYSFGNVLSTMRNCWNQWNDFKAFQKLDEKIPLLSVDSQRENVCLEFDNVWFKYPNTERWVIKGISFKINTGSKVVIVGKNGAGKSTVVKLAMGLYKPQKGNVKINGTDVFEIEYASRKKLISCVFQDYVKYPMTIRENVGLGDLSNLYNDMKILAAMEHGTINEILQDSEFGLETVLGKIFDNSLDLSEGQWQRLSIARTMMTDARILLLDEPVASLDASSETQLYNVFLDLAQKKTCVIVSHRLGCAKIGNRIIVIDDGKLVEDGTHEQLMTKKNLYYEMYTAQSEFYRKGDSDHE